MAKYVIDGSTLTEIADAIREKSGTTDALLPTDMATAIAAISGGGVELPDGYAMEMGVFTPESDITTTNPLTITLENVYKWYNSSRDATSTYMGYVAVSLVTGTQAAWAGMYSRYGGNTRSHFMVTTASSTSTSTTVMISPINTTSFSSIKLNGTTAYPFKTGVTYLWYVIGALA